MAVKYVYSGAAGAADGTSWADAYVSLSAATAGISAGDTVYVADDHSATYGSNTTLNFPGTDASPNRILCVDRAGSVPPVAADLSTGAKESVNIASAQLSLRGGTGSEGRFYCEGVEFEVGDGGSSTVSLNINSAGSQVQTYKNCIFSLATTGGSSRVNANGVNDFTDCKLKFGSTSQRFSVAAGWQRWMMNSETILAAGSSTPTTPFQFGGSGVIEVHGADLSAISGTIFAADANTSKGSLVNCKLHASATITGTPTGSRFQGIELIGCHSSGSVGRNEKYNYRGTLTTETTIVRTGGASDGVTPYSWKIVPTANNERDFFPFETFEFAMWNDDIGSPKTLTVHTVTDNVTLTDGEIWLEAEILGDSGSPIASLISDAAATVLTTPANQASSSEAWTTTGLGSPVKQQLDVTFTPEMAGLIRGRVKYAKTSTNVYVCPKPELS